MRRRCPRSTLVPYTTLFRSWASTSSKCCRSARTRSARCARGERQPRPPPELSAQRGLQCIFEPRNLAHSQAFDRRARRVVLDRKSTRLNSSHSSISYAVFCLNETPVPEIYTRSLHDALPILGEYEFEVLQIGENTIRTVRARRTAASPAT